jgi:hypothetical protein
MYLGNLPPLKNYQFEFDPQNKILLLRVEGRLTDELATEVYWSVRKYSTATHAQAGIWDLSAVTDLAVSPEVIREVASREPAMADAKCPRFLVAPPMTGLSLACLFEMTGSDKNPLLKVVLSRNEALEALGVQTPRFEFLA